MWFALVGNFSYLCAVLSRNSGFMHKKLFLVLLFLLPVLAVSSKSKKDRRSVVRIETTMGNIRVALLDDAPVHRDNFLKLAESGHYDGTLFHRVILQVA